ncbi:MAG: acetate--CoA ligase [Gammaproteobacteria bacterium]|nr:acetate--CoA ligase [Gammaproteobacteria bacterium]
MTDISVLLKEQRTFKPTQEFINQTNVKQWMDQNHIASLEELYEKASDWKWFWEKMSKEFIHFYQPYKKVVDWKPPYVKWFVGSKYNIVHDALDLHMQTDVQHKIAYIYESEPGETQKITYGELNGEVNKLANALKQLGVKKRDRVGIYLPMIPQLPIAMLACAKIGAIHSVVFSGFSALAFRGRMNDCQAKVIITCDAFYRRGKKIFLKEQTDTALEDTPSVKHAIVYRRTGDKIHWKSGRDIWWHDLVKNMPKICETEPLDANDPLFYLYTSGTTGKPKGIIHAHAGYALGAALTLHWVLDVKPTDIYWCAADIGWITGHSYIVYAPLILGITSVLYEGAPDFPLPDRWWSIIAKYNINILYTSPTAIRFFMQKGDEWPQKHDLSSLRLLGSVGEPINPEAWIWYYATIGKEKCPIMDTWWQTETGHFMISPLPISTLKPGSAVLPIPGVSADVYNEQGESIIEAGGNLVITHPWPGMLRGIYGDPARYQETYWDRYKNIYLAGDIARIDQERYFWIQGRADDVLSVSGHRIGNSEIESALVSYEAVAEAAIIGVPDPIKGESIIAYVILKNRVKSSPELIDILRQHVAHEIGKLARPDRIYFVRDVPKTRSGKIMRRVIRAKALGKEIGDISTLANPESIDEILKI